MPKDVKISFDMKSKSGAAGQAVSAALAAAQNNLAATVYKIDDQNVWLDIETVAKRKNDNGDRIAMRVLVDAQQLSDAATLRRLTRLEEEKNVEIRQWTKGKLHMKLLIVDDQRVLSGSYNWTDSANRENTELMLEFEGTKYAKKFTKIFDQLWVHAAAIALPHE